MAKRNRWLSLGDYTPSHNHTYGQDMGDSVTDASTWVPLPSLIKRFSLNPNIASMYEDDSSVVDDDSMPILDAYSSDLADYGSELARIRALEFKGRSPQRPSVRTRSEGVVKGDLPPSTSTSTSI